MSAAEASAAYQQSLDDLLTGVIAGIVEEYGSLDEALNANMTGFDDTTQAGRDLQQATFDVARTQKDAAVAALDLAVAQGGDLVQAGTDLQTSLQASQDALYQTLVDMGIEEGAARALAQSIVDVPDLSETEVIVEDAVAKAKVAAHDAAIRNLPPEWTTKLFGDESDAVAAAAAARAAVYSVPTSRTTHYYGSGTPARRSSPRAATSHPVTVARSACSPRPARVSGSSPSVRWATSWPALTREVPPGSSSLRTWRAGPRPEPLPRQAEPSRSKS